MLWPASKLGSRGTMSSLVELGLRSLVLVVFLGLSIALALDDSNPLK